MRKIFISYRRTDAEYAAGALGRDLRRCFGDQQIFRDKEDIGGGAQWRAQLLREIDKDSALLVLIGRDWANIKDSQGNRRLDNLDDVLRLEISDGIKDGAAIVPVLLENAQMPNESELPPELRRLLEFHALKLRDGDWQQDLDTICRTLVRVGFKPVGSAPEAPEWEQPVQAPGPKQGPNIKGLIAAALMVPVFAALTFLDVGRERLLGAAVLSVVALVLGILAWRERKQDRFGIIVSTLAIVGLLAALGKMDSASSPQQGGSSTARQPESAPDSTVTASKAGGLTSIELLGGHAVVRYDPGVWLVDKTDPTSPGSFQFVYTSGQLRLKVTSQPLQLGPDVLANTMLVALQSVDKAAEMTRRGSRRVNGVDMVVQEFEAIDKNIPLTYYAHYYSDTSGSVEIIGWTYQSLIDAHRPTIERFMSGFELTGQRR